ncbi:MAG: cell division ATP-binding protein FtsE [Candidatus Harrisonbacteria bacterium]|nr:cell division ATP-binding protein FtsE [Candidatus Harrisonbacteria bacterium]
MIHFQNVEKHYGTHNKVLKGINFDIRSGEFVTLVGRSGAGKSTLISLLIGEEKPTSGKIIFHNIEVNKLEHSDLPHLRRQIGIIFQEFHLLPKKTASENIAFAMELAGKNKNEIKETVPQVLDMVGLLDRRNNFPNELSGGEKQRVAIARAMVNRPSLIIADEPTGNLDPGNTWEIMRILLKINELGTTVILATHSKEVIDKISRRVITIEEGVVSRDEKNGKYRLE